MFNFGCENLKERKQFLDLIAIWRVRYSMCIWCAIWSEERSRTMWHVQEKSELCSYPLRIMRRQTRWNLNSLWAICAYLRPICAYLCLSAPNLHLSGAYLRPICAYLRIFCAPAPICVYLRLIKGDGCLVPTWCRLVAEATPRGIQKAIEKLLKTNYSQSNSIYKPEILNPKPFILNPVS